MVKKIKSFISHPLFSGSAVMIGGSMCVNALGYLYHLVIGRLLGPIHYGTLASIFSLLQIIIIIPTSSSIAIVKFISSAKNSKEVSVIYNALKSFMFKLAIGFSLALLLLTPFIRSFLHIEEIWSVVFVSPVLFFSLVVLVNQATLQGLLDFSGVVVPNMISAILKLVLGVLFVLIGWSVGGAIGGVAIAAMVAYVYSVYEIKRRVPLENKGHFDFGKFVKFVFPSLMQALAFTVMFTFDVLLVKHFLPSFEAGLYAALSNLGKIIYFATTPVSSVMFPIVSGRHAKGGKYGKVFAYSFAASILLSGLVLGFYFLFPDFAISILYGKAYLLARSELVWMGLFISFLTLSYFLVNFFLSIGKTRAVIFPMVVSIIQIIGIVLFHNSILQVIQISLVCMVFLFFSLSFYLLYNHFKVYAKE